MKQGLKRGRQEGLLETAQRMLMKHRPGCRRRLCACLRRITWRRWTDVADRADKGAPGV